MLQAALRCCRTAVRLDVLALLDVPVLAARSKIITEEGLRYHLRQWVNESGVRWGMDVTTTSVELDLPATGQHTCRFGLTPCCWATTRWTAAGEWRSVLPYDESSGLIAELVGNRVAADAA